MFDDKIIRRDEIKAKDDIMKDKFSWKNKGFSDEDVLIMEIFIRKNKVRKERRRNVEDVNEWIKSNKRDIRITFIKYYDG